LSPLRVGWTLDDLAHEGRRIVTSNNGVNIIRASDATESVAWRVALEQAEPVGMVADG
jgi:hypothetical protein